MMDAADIPSPCVGVCEIEPDSGLCAGCLRTRAEIAQWRGAGPEARLAVVRALRQRRTARGRKGRGNRRRAGR